MKLKTIYLCQKCDHQAPKWIGKCPECSGWNTFVEDVINVGKKDIISRTPRKAGSTSPTKLVDSKKAAPGITSSISEFDRVMGDGIVPGSLTLISGEPGIGKSTLTLQVANNIAKDKSVLMISGEESVEQIAQRARRLGANNENLKAVNGYNLEDILETIRKEKHQKPPTNYTHFHK